MNRQRFNELFSLSNPNQDPDEMFWLTQFVEELGPHVVVEIGVQEGGSLQVWESLMEPGDLLVGVDNDPRFPDLINHHRWDWRGSDRNVVLISGDSTEDLTIDKVKKALSGRQVDLLLIDGNHEYDYVKKDFLNYSLFVRNKGMVVFHDIVGYPGPKQFFNEIVGRKDSIGICPRMGCGIWWKP